QRRLGVSWTLTDNVTERNINATFYLNPGSHNVPGVSHWWQPLKSRTHVYTIWAAVYPPGTVFQEKVKIGVTPIDQQALNVRRLPPNSTEGRCRLKTWRPS